MDQLRKFYKNRAKKPYLYTYDDDGNLIEKAKDGSIINKIVLKKYRPITIEEYDIMEQKRIEKIKIAEKEFEESRISLYEAKNNQNISSSELIQLNRLVSNKDIALQSIRMPLREILELESIDVKDILLDKPKEKRKFPHTVHTLITRPYKLEDQYVKAASDNANETIVLPFMLVLFAKIDLLNRLVYVI